MKRFKLGRERNDFLLALLVIVIFIIAMIITLPPMIDAFVDFIDSAFKEVPKI